MTSTQVSTFLSNFTFDKDPAKDEAVKAKLSANKFPNPASLAHLVRSTLIELTTENVKAELAAFESNLEAVGQTGKEMDPEPQTVG